MRHEPFPVVPVHQVPPTPPTARWLIENLWSQEAVGILGGFPKLGKTWLALDLAVSVASGTPALGTFPVTHPGTVLVYAAEDNLRSVRDRVAAIADMRSRPLDSLSSLRLLDIPELRLDSTPDIDRLRSTLELHRPCLLILDPLVRVHSADENSAADIASLLGTLRTIQREYHTAVLLVHHLRKNGPVGQPGQALRGSGDLHAWGDDNLYLHHRNGGLLLTVEHRHAAAPDPIRLELVKEPVPHLRPAPPERPALEPDPGLEERIVSVLAQAGRAVDRETLRQALHSRNQTLSLALVHLRQQGRIERCAGGFRLMHPASPVPDTAHAGERNALGPPT